MNDAAWNLIAAAVQGFKQRISQLELCTKELLGHECRFFLPLSLSSPYRSCAELVFLRAIFWLHGLLHECAGSPIRSCLRQSQFSDDKGQSLLYLDELKALRTYVSHNLDGASESDQRTEFTCLQWYRRTCRSQPPMSDDAWNQCTLALISGADILLQKICDFFGLLKSMPDAGFLVDEVRRAAARQITPYVFDSIVTEVADDFGRSDINLVKFRANHQKSWIDSLVKLREGYDFRHEARRVIEESFLANPERSPVSGRDIIEQLAVPAGKNVGKLVLIAQQLFNDGVRDKPTIIERLREHRDALISGEGGE